MYVHNFNDLMALPCPSYCQYQKTKSNSLKRVLKLGKNTKKYYMQTLGCKDIR